MFESKVPNLIKLSQIGNPDFASGKPTAVYINPLQITVVVRGRGTFTQEKDQKAFHPRVECTIICLATGQQIMVTESQEVVASLHERALREMTEH